MTIYRITLFVFLTFIYTPFSDTKASGFSTEEAFQSEEFLVFYRGYHYGAGTPDNIDSETNYAPHQEVPSRYISSIEGFSPDRKISENRALQNLLNAAPYKVDGKTYPSAYHWIQEMYVNKYGKFKEDIQNPDSALSKLFQKAGLSFNDIPFVSTSLNCRTAVKYALGLCSGEYKKWPNWTREIKRVGYTTGFVDIFFIPRSDLKSLGAFAVVEQFASHGIELPYKFNQKNYTLAEEYTFPLSIPAKYHRKRFPITVEKRRAAKKPDFLTGFMWRQSRRISTKIESEIEKLVQTEELSSPKKRIYLSFLRHRVGDQKSKLSPKGAAKLHEKVGLLMVKTFEAIKSKCGKSNYRTLSLPASLSIERTFEKFQGEEFSLQGTDPCNFSVDNMIPLLRYPNLTEVTLGQKKSYDEVYEDSIGMGSGNWCINDRKVELLIQEAEKRTKPFVFKLYYIMDPQNQKIFRAITEQTGGKIRFVLDVVQNSAAQDAERHPIGAALWCDDEMMSVITPNAWRISNILGGYISKLEQILEKSSAIIQEKFPLMAKKLHLFEFFSGELSALETCECSSPDQAIRSLEENYLYIDSAFNDACIDYEYDHGEAAADKLWDDSPEFREPIEKAVEKLYLTTISELENLEFWPEGFTGESSEDDESLMSEGIIGIFPPVYSLKRNPPTSVTDLEQEHKKGIILKKKRKKGVYEAASHSESMLSDVETSEEMALCNEVQEEGYAEEGGSEDSEMDYIQAVIQRLMNLPPSPTKLQKRP